MIIVTTIIQLTHFDRCPRDNELWALEARVQVLLNEMMTPQEEDEIECMIVYDTWLNCWGILVLFLPSGC